MNVSPDALSADLLSRLLAPLGLQRFFAEYWQQRSLHLEIAPDVFEGIVAEVGPLDIPRMAGLATQGCQAWLSNQHMAHSVFPVGPSDAQAFYDAGATLYFLNIPVTRLTDGAADCLGVPRDRVIASVFVTPPGGGASLHFDKNENFTIQLTGKKQWHVGDRPSLRNAPESHIWGRDLKGRLALLSSEISDQPRCLVDLIPGSLLYVPRGTVHGTEAGEASWSLNISYTGFMWVDLLCDRLRHELLKMPEWRGSVLGVRPTSAVEAQLGNRLPALLLRLSEVLKPEMIVNPHHPIDPVDRTPTD